MKDLIYDCMNTQKPGINPISYGSGFAIDYTLLLHDLEDYELMKAFIVELEHNDLEPRIEEQMTYWIYQVKQGLFRDDIPDADVMKKDIEKIESMMRLRFEDLECYQADE